MAQSKSVIVGHGEVPVGDLHTLPETSNPRRGQIDRIRESLREFGFYRTVVVRKPQMTVLAGNHTVKAATAEGWDTIHATFVEVTDEQADRIVIVDNRLNDLAHNDDRVLAAMLASFDGNLAGTGFTADEFQDLLMKTTPPSLDELAERYGEATERDTWPTLRLSMPREVLVRFEATMAEFTGEPWEQVQAMLDAIDGS